MRDHSDRELVERARRGEAAAVGELYSRYWRAARAAAFGVTGEMASAEDAAAEAFRQALAGIASLQDPDRFGSWLRTIVVRQARLARRRGQDPAVETSEIRDGGAPPDEAFASLEAAALVRQGLHVLPPSLREAIVLVYFEGYESSLAARFLEIPPGTLRRRLHDGRLRLRVAVETILKARKPMGAEREHEMQRIREMMGSGDTYAAMRDALALRPGSRDFVEGLLRRHTIAGVEPLTVDFPRIAGQLLRPSGRVADLGHPVGAIAAAIRTALPEFTAAEVHHNDAVTSFYRATRAVVRLTDSGRAQSVYELTQDSPDLQTFRRCAGDLRLSDVLDLTWTRIAQLDLHSVQARLEQLTSAVFPGTRPRFSAYDEPRYRAALQLHFPGIAARAAYGGVLAAWPACPGMDAAHVRIHLEPWATLRSGEPVALDSLPANISDFSGSTHT